MPGHFAVYSKIGKVLFANVVEVDLAERRTHPPLATGRTCRTECGTGVAVFIQPQHVAEVVYFTILIHVVRADGPVDIAVAVVRNETDLLYDRLFVKSSYNVSDRPWIARIQTVEPVRESTSVGYPQTAVITPAVTLVFIRRCTRRQRRETHVPFDIQADELRVAFRRLKHR